MGSALVKPDHLDRKAVVYVRQSTPHQVIINKESLKLQYALSQRARELGWREVDIDVIDSDLGQSAAAAAHRKGFKDLVARVTLGEVGLILSMDVTAWRAIVRIGTRCLMSARIAVVDRRPLWHLRSRNPQWPPAAGPEGYDLRAGIAHDQKPDDRRANDAGLCWPRLGTASRRSPWRSALAACHGVSRDSDPQESGLCRRLCLWKGLAEAIPKAVETIIPHMTAGAAPAGDPGTAGLHPSSESNILRA